MNVLWRKSIFQQRLNEDILIVEEQHCECLVTAAEWGTSSVIQVHPPGAVVVVTTVRLCGRKEAECGANFGPARNKS